MFSRRMPLAAGGRTIFFPYLEVPQHEELDILSARKKTDLAKTVRLKINLMRNAAKDAVVET